MIHSFLYTSYPLLKVPMVFPESHHLFLFESTIILNLIQEKIKVRSSLLRTEFNDNILIGTLVEK